MPFVFAGVRIEDDDAMIEIPVSHEQFICLRVDEQTGRTSEILRIIAAAILSRVPDLHEELSLVRELEDLIVFFVVPAQPDVVLRVD